MYASEMEDILRDGVEYDTDDNNAIADVEKAPLHRLQLIR